MGKKKRNSGARVNRATKRTYKANNEFFTGCCETFVNVLIANMFDWESDKVKAEFERVDTIWRNRARSLINSAPSVYNNQALRSNLTNNFSKFVENLKSKPLGELREKIEDEPEVEIKETTKVIPYAELTSINSHPETIGMIMRENGVSTQAKTHAGLKSVFDGLSYEQQVKICESLGSIKCS